MQSKLSLRLAATITALWALGYPLGALGIQAMSPILLLAWRFGVSAVVVLLFVRVRRITLPRGRQLAHVIVVGLLVQVGQFGALYIALSHGVPAVVCALAVALNPVATLALTSAISRTAPPRRLMGAVLLGVAAIVAAFTGRLIALGHIDAGVLLTMVGLAALAVGGIYQQRYVVGVDPSASNAIQLNVAATVTVPLALLTPHSVADVRLAFVVVPLMAVLSSALCTTLYQHAVAVAGAMRASMLFSVIPSVTGVLAWVILGQRPDVGIGIGLVLGAIGCVLGLRQGRAPLPTDAARSTLDPARKASEWALEYTYH